MYAEPFELPIDFIRRRRIRNRRRGRLMPLGLLDQLARMSMGAKPDGTIRLAEVLNDIKRADADGAGRAEDGDALGQAGKLYRMGGNGQVRAL